MEMDQFDLSDPKVFFEELIKKALTGKQSDFEFIRNSNMWAAARLYKSSINKVIKIFKSLQKSLLEEYSNSILTDKQAVDVLLSMKQFERCVEYYTKEKAIAKDMLSEFGVYFRSGHRFHILFGGERAAEDLVDYRTLSVSLFGR